MAVYALSRKPLWSHLVKNEPVTVGARANELVDHGCVLAALEVAIHSQPDQTVTTPNYIWNDVTKAQHLIQF